MSDSGGNFFGASSLWLGCQDGCIVVFLFPGLGSTGDFLGI